MKYLYEDIVFISKVITFPLSYLLFTAVARQKPDMLNQTILSVTKILFYTLLGALILAVLGFGNSNYGEVEEGGMSYGYKGYFIAGNELSSLYILVYAFFCYYMYKKVSNFFLLILGLVAGLIVAGLIVTKTAMISYLAITLATPFLLKYRESRSMLSYTRYDKKFLTIFVLLPVLTMSILYTVFYERVQANIDRMAYNFAKAGELSSFLLSGRNDRFDHAKELYLEDYSVTEKIIGTGWEHPQTVVATQKLGWGTTEVDYLDILTSNGLLGLLAIYLFWFVVLVKLARAFLHKGGNEFSTPAFLGFMLLFVNSFISGHIIYSAMLGFYLGFFTIPAIQHKQLRIEN
ncbi:O-antigen ligase family protein [Chitinophaga pollutisoli]|uniref:O-antigen ligase family protein n=1 Tax=Chitinophaga pollutisoli TaxID=3133966 RepID=A0ABZ2YWP8_9BACT